MLIDDRSENLTTEMFCSSPVGGILILRFLIIISIFLAISSTFGNILILAALRKVSFLHPPSKILLRSLILTDLCVGIAVGPLYVIFLFTIEFKNWNFCCQVISAVLLSGQTLCSVSLLTMTAIGVDRLLALSLGLRYRQVVTSRRAQGTAISLWFIGSGGAIMELFNYRTALFYGSFLVLLSITVSTFCYLKIYRKLRQHQGQVHGNIHQRQANRPEPLNIARYRKTVSSAVWIQLSLIAFYLPGIVIITLVASRGLDPILLLVCICITTFIHFNSTLNPVLYCWTMREVRQVMRGNLRQTFRF